MKVVSDQQTREARAKQEKEKELSKVKINKDDVDLIVSEAGRQLGVLHPVNHYGYQGEKWP